MNQQRTEPLDQLDQFNQLKEKMNSFMKNIHEIMNAKSVDMITTVENFKTEMKELNHEQKTLLTRLNKLRKEEEGLEIEIQTFKTDTDEARTKFQTYQIRRVQLQSQRDSILKESKELETMLHEKELRIKEYKDKLQRQRQRDNPEVKLYEALLGMEIDASQNGTLTFRFTRFDDRDLDKSCQLTLDVAGEEFKILHSNPELDADTDKQELETLLNSSNNLPLFLVAIRDKLLSVSAA
ncbi:kinetochore-associated Ndc80 complex subunit SPC25 NDAI_0A00530 [Naumovozyma dairenensis CBS 421]|uniref:Kinetochore protein SPC25 n=1 Tax=Naumovozyma dairenensis (strain ATCC 10597 / BCRC 20456 / CBS 421 / NBRC 0211 / NRRL Y-12639) TaxID=1071378 RepID=G0W323_NAUDC|nr:hypothetical protein NDAI_0A00530 [Naumovozyma dairenensis CBS 421]CCD22211.1 hypothetical protein NDAI_0A00530 [Naumovozyma dairenensis CBS 421]